MQQDASREDQKNFWVPGEVISTFYRAPVGPDGRVVQRRTFLCVTDVVYYYRFPFITVCLNLIQCDFT